MWIGKVGAYTEDLIESRVFSDSEKEEDMAAWEKLYESKHGEKFEYKEIEFNLVLAEKAIKPG
ncbi:hypothetical protein HP548_02575 [Paenibacillus taichungensis]|uniref:ASCH domain-containing protein n=1 Tax=Paenibacillus taichungensis TaxID=484184 RepID=A0ABX2ME71_9BACL|nr:hypothetical protein [Paenibacillus taichungensis]NUU52980.1 hypothetical protein [Paenibacillus taichungensis]